MKDAIDLAPIAQIMNEYFDGNPLILSQWLDRAVYMFHYLPEGENFTQLQKQNTCHAIMRLKESLLEIYFKENNWD